MKSILLLTIITLFANAQLLTVIDNGVKREIYLPDSSSIEARGVDNNIAKQELIIAFKKDTNIKDFANRYNLEIKTVIAKKYFIFKNNSKLKDADLISKIISSESCIKTIRPNWGFGFIAR